MTDSLPFELKKNHKTQTKYQWKRQGMIFTQEEFELIYEEYIYSTNCNLCDKKFKTVKGRNLDHDHKTGEIRDIICRSCNNKRKDNTLRKDNSTGHRNIYYEKANNRYVFTIKFSPETNAKWIKSSVDLDKLVKFANEWYKDNKYYT
tara:strand:+ start:86 stop:526 length:441 start_codon:yes stop_codon:yes gene_type:complete